MQHRDLKPIPTDIHERRERLTWLDQHPAWCHPEDPEWPMSSDCFHIRFAYVQPDTQTIDHDDDSKNTRFEAWVEGGPWQRVAEEPWPRDNPYETSKDYRLNSAATDLETALLRFAAKVELHYGDDGIDRGRWPCWWKDDSKGPEACEDAGDGYCKHCGFGMETANN